MHHIDIKPLSVNEAFTGRRFKTPAYKVYKKSLGFLLPKISVPEGKLHIRLEFGLSSAGSDADNCCKNFVDCAAEKYRFNDNLVYRYEIDKVVVEKGKEYIRFEILPFLDKLNSTK